MYFCPKCNFSLDIIKNVNNPFITEIENPDEFLDLIESNNMEGIIKINFLKKDLLSNKNYKSLKKDKAESILKLYENFQLDTSKNSFFICNNCNYHSMLSPGTIIFKTTVNEDQVDDTSLIKNRINDNTLPRTKDFICPNKCKVSNKDKEAIFYRPFHNSYVLNYICCNCNATWSP